ncbi:MAG: NAD(P)-dependent glycerol-3-phosphate dehydrogenase [Actinobacteria bacterium]|jgi:glycerol-3-phosphate dehydrogenase (NAD(P)+)|nr:NAD(P)-dependent glycerol-3-phosphate dehydrogenase [Actinomycetota bacterium]MBT3687020.1 NAD(P)-dependent glycerol-3-phosphate dehydrogenase [Actinomycetota bacterium]MBT4037449.1 NAD(P)-dependent glycerol-3-phosphate dehydrogenase [Actinomycetota bacterium]MBT4279749.1 NAD(P)-dependent glycerol-3-phosphate dehydrogenase [Actinomycetota bacterium]MBT4342704.1 NAD(P)-dependent glycerol-3-phosphate dehydrogenase [Actinomycetota bacterium]
MAGRVAVLGAGSWGTTVASLLASVVPTVLWARDPDLAVDLASGRGNSRYLPGLDLASSLEATADLGAAVGEADLILAAIPTHGFRSVLADASAHLAPGVPVLSLAKGFEQGSGLRMTQVAAEILPDRPVGVLTGPNLAKEILVGKSAAMVVASTDAATAERLQGLLSSDSLRVYTNDDLVGCEIGGAVKNVIALAAGMAEGLDTGDNARAALINRGLAEMTRLGEALGGDPRTLAGLAGMGDLLATCISPQSRNRWVGEQVGRGRYPAEVLAEMHQVAEGVPAAGVVCYLAAEAGVEVPIATGVREVFEEGRPPLEVWADLMTRRARPEVG